MAYRSKVSSFTEKEKEGYQSALAILLNAKHKTGWLSLSEHKEDFGWPVEQKDKTKEQTN